MDRKGRGRLSTIDMLPDEAETDIVWANDALRDNKRQQIDILAEFNQRLAARGIEPISPSAFNRYSVRKAMQFREADEQRRISGELVRTLGTDGADTLTVAVAEMTKMAAFRLYERGIDDPKAVLELGRATHAAASAQKVSLEYRQKIEAETTARAVKAVERVARERGMTAETVEAVKSAILGVRKPA